MSHLNISTIIIIITGITSFLAFSNQGLLDGLIFWPYRIWRNNEWYRLISCSFIHADMQHLLFNMLTFFFFGPYIENAFTIIFGSAGTILFITMYFGAVATADIYNLFKSRNDYAYRSLGASGGVSAIIFSYILFNPLGQIYLFFIPIGIPAALFGVLYLIYCAYSAKQGRDNIGHIAHFTGSVFGFIFPILFQPTLFKDFIYKLSGQ
jgi:membrane associated rhomboid family serine protease